jgi:glycosyltransferase involved in cell wall biosynthesis
MNRYCLLIPHYNHERQLLGFLPQLLSVGLPLLLVDDGSSPESLAQLQAALDEHRQNSANPPVHLFAMHVNRGKGSAVKNGLVFARNLGFTHCIQIDADGQHSVADIPRFIAVSDAKPDALVSGRPVFDDSAPKARLYGRKVTDVFVALETLSLRIKDSLCGYRVYPLTQMEALLDHYYIGPRMDFDTEMMVKSVWMGVEVEFIDTAVIYPEQSVSHFHYLRDNLLLIRLHSRLLLGMLWHSPVILWRRLRGR